MYIHVKYNVTKNFHNSQLCSIFQDYLVMYTYTYTNTHIHNEIMRIKLTIVLLIIIFSNFILKAHMMCPGSDIFYPSLKMQIRLNANNDYIVCHTFIFTPEITWKLGQMLINFDVIIIGEEWRKSDFFLLIFRSKKQLPSPPLLILLYRDGMEKKQEFSLLPFGM